MANPGLFAALLGCILLWLWGAWLIVTSLLEILVWTLSALNRFLFRWRDRLEGANRRRLLRGKFYG